MKQFVLLILMMPVVVRVSFCQDQTIKRDEKPVLQGTIKVIAKSYGDSVVLRWAPSDSWAWNKLNYTGYIIQRITLDEKDNAKKELMTPVPLKPYPLEKFKTVFKSSNTNAAIAAQCLYGRNFDMGLRKGQGAIEDEATVSDARFSYTLMVADYDAGVAMATALRFADKNVKKAGKYLYRVMPAGTVSQGRIDTGSVLVENNTTAVNAKPEIAEGIAFDHLGELHWARNGMWSGFYIERSSDGGKIFTLLNSLPFISSRPDPAALKKDSSKAKLFALLQTQHVYIDSLPKNYTNYVYRIRGINAFAEISDYSGSVTISGKDLTAPVAVNMLNPQFVSGRSIKLLWKKDFIEGDCKGYYVTRARTINGPYETLNQQILPAATTEFTDNFAFLHGGNFYIVVAADTTGNIASSVPAMGLVPDNTPPSIPVGLKGNIEKNGRVNLYWTANKEDDIKGYKVYFANAPDHVFTQVTTGPDTALQFTDSISLNTLTKEIWYKIAAVDYNNNHSEFSAAVQLKKPDIVPPTAPVATNIVVQKSGVAMDWIQSSSADAVSYTIYRAEEKQKPVPVARFKHIPGIISFHFTDTTVTPNTNLVYMARTIDEDSLQSPFSLPVMATIHHTAQRAAITTLKAFYDIKAKLIHISWQYTETGDYFFILSAAYGTDSFRPIRSFDKQKNSYNDLNPEKGITCRYTIQAIWKDDSGNTMFGQPGVVIIPQ